MVADGLLTDSLRHQQPRCLQEPQQQHLHVSLALSWCTAPTVLTLSSIFGEAKIEDLKRSGAINDQEYQQMRARVLS